MEWSQLVLPALQALKPYQAGITEQKLRRDTGLDAIFKFSSNEVPYPPAPAVAAAMREALGQANRYPDTGALLDDLAAHLDVPAARIALGNGSIDLIESLVRLFVDERHNVVLSRYGYSAYGAFIQTQRGAIRLAESNPDFGHQVDRLLALVDADTRLIVIDSPTNLSGQWLGAAEVERLLAALPAHVVLVLDEAYVEFPDPTLAAATLALARRYPRLVLTRTFSKAYGLAGMRIGYAVADPAVIDYLGRIGRPFPVAGVALAGARAALADQAHMARTVAAIAQGRRQLVRALSGLGLTCHDGGANFVLVDLGEVAQRVYQGALARGFILRAMHAYGLPRHVRVSIGSGAEIERLVEVVATLLSTEHA